MNLMNNIENNNKQNNSNCEYDDNIIPNYIECPYCHSDGLQIEFREYYYNGTKKEYKCKVCNRSFMRSI